MSAIFSLIPVRKVVASLLLSGALLAGVSAQQGPQLRQIHELDLETSILLAREQSRDMKSLRLNLETSALRLRSSLSSYKPQIGMNLTTPQYSKTIRQFEDSSGITYYSVEQNVMSGSMSITQLLPSDGRISVTSRLTNTADYNDNTRSAQLSSSISLVQPLSVIWGYNNYRIALKAARLNYEKALKSFKRQELDLVYDVTQAFYNLIRARETMNIAMMTYDNQKKAYELAQSKFKVGLIREVDALQMEVDLSGATISLDEKQESYANQQQTFKEFLGIDMKDSILLKDDLSLKVVMVDEEKAVELAMQNRLEIRESAISIEQQEMSIRQTKADGRISGNLNLTYNFQGVTKDDREIPLQTTFQDTWQNMIDRKGNIGATVSLTVPILDWGRNRASVRMAENQLKQLHINDDATKISIERAMRSSVSSLERNLRSYLVLEKSVELAEKSFQISLDRYSNGDIDSEAIASERVRLNNTYVSRLSAYISYKLLLSDIMRQTFYDFEKGVSLVDPAIK